MGKLRTDIAVWRKPNGPFLYTTSKGVMVESQTPKYLSTVDRAMMSVRVDMRLSLSDIEFKTRASLEPQP